MNVHLLVMTDPPGKSSSTEPPVLSLAALAVPVICGTVLLIFHYQITAFLIGLLSFFLAVPSMLLCLLSPIMRERPRWIAGVAFAANCLLIYSLTFIDLH